MKSVIFCLLMCATSLTAQKSLITTTGTAIEYVVPDEILINLDIETVESELSQARRLNAAKTRQIIDFLKSNHIASKHIQTQLERVGPIYRRNTREVENYQASQNISVCIKQLDKYDKIIDGLLGLKVHRIQGPNFRTTELPKYKEKARIAAIIAAREKALTLANALGQSIGKAHIIKEILYSASPHANAYANTGMSDDMNGGASLALGQMQVQATIEVSFELE